MKKEELTHLKCLFNDALQPAVHMPNFTLAARSRAQFTINSWKTGCGMEKLLASLRTPALATGWQSTQDNRKAFREPRFLLCGQCLGIAIPWKLLHPCAGGGEREAGDSVRGGMLRGAVPQLPVHVAGMVNHQLRFCSVALLWEH